MRNRELIIGLLVVLLSFGLDGTVFAADDDAVRASEIGSEAGSWQLVAASSSTNADRMAVSSNQGHDSLAANNSEAGNWQYRFDAAETSVDKAARGYNYSQESLSAVGTEAGNSQFSFDSSARSDMKAICSSC